MRAVRASPLRSWGRASLSPSPMLPSSPRSSLPRDWNAGDPIVFESTSELQGGMGATGEKGRAGEWQSGDPIVFSSASMAGVSQERRGLDAGLHAASMNDNYPSSPRRPRYSQDPSSSIATSTSNEAESVSATSQVEIAGALSPVELQQLLEGIDFNDSLGLDDSGDEFTSALESISISTDNPSSKDNVKIHSFDRRSPSPLDSSCQTDLFTPSPPTSALYRPSSPAFLSSPIALPSTATNGRPQQRRHASSSRLPTGLSFDEAAAMIERSPQPAKNPTSVKGKARVVIEVHDSSSDVEIVEPKPRPTPAASTSTAASAKGGWFIKPAGLLAATLNQTLKVKAPRKARFNPAAEKKAADDAQLHLDHPISFAFDQYPEPPRLIYTSDPAEVERVLGEMTGPLGFDLEWDIATRRGAENRTALAQICDEKTVLLVHIARMRSFPPALKALIEDPTRIKLGVQIAGDARKLNRDFEHVPAGLLELNNVARTVDPSYFVGRSSHLVSLQKLCAQYTGKYLAKDTGIRCGVWSGALGDSQKYYAANDVYSSLQIYLRLVELADSSVDLSTLISSDMSTASRWNPPRPLIAHRKLAPATTGSTTPNARQLEAYGLYNESFTIEEISSKMSGNKKLLPLSVVWYILGALDGDRSLPFDPERLVGCVEKVKGGSKTMMEQEFEEFIRGVKDGSVTGRPVVVGSE